MQVCFWRNLLAARTAFPLLGDIVLHRLSCQDGSCRMFSQQGDSFRDLQYISRGGCCLFSTMQLLSC